MTTKRNKHTMSNEIHIQKNFSGSYVANQNVREIRFQKERGQWIATERVNDKNRSCVGGQNLKQTIAKAFDVDSNFWQI